MSSSDQRPPLLQRDHRVIDVSDLDVEEAETHNVNVIEERQRRRSNSGTGGSASGRHVDFSHWDVLTDSDPTAVADTAASEEDHGSTTSKPPSFQSMARRVRLAKQMSEKRLNLNRHRKTNSTAAEILQAMGTDASESEHKPLLLDDGSALSVRAQPLFGGAIEGDDEEDDEEEDESYNEDEALPVMQTGQAYGSISPTPRQKVQASIQRRRQSSNRSFRRFRRALSTLLQPQRILNFILHRAFRSLIVLVAVPLCGVAWILYYVLDNPELDFLPGTARLAWWFNFLGRQVITLEIARVTEWLVVDVIMLSRFSVRLFGPLFTFFIIQSDGWPFVVGAWGVWDMLLLHGNNQFQQHWFAWTGWKIYSLSNSGEYILESDLYLRLLLSMGFLGIATAIKRTILAIRFGRRQLAEFKPRLEKLLADVVLVTEVALIAMEAAAMDESGELRDEKGPAPRESKGLAVQWLNVDFREPISCHETEDPVDLVDDIPPPPPQSSPMQGENMLSESPPESTRRPPSLHEQGRDVSGGSLDYRYLARRPSGSFRIKDLLDRWEEPVNKSQKTSEGTITDVVKFRRVLQFMDETYPFGEAFGPAMDRNQCIGSAQAVYHSLKKLSSSASAVPFSTITLSSVDENGAVDDAKAKAMMRVFRPDVNGELPLLAFIQCVDAVYRRYKFFRASVGNASVIDRVLENIINGVFFFVIGLMLLSFMQFNPWALLVSLTSLLVSVSFALGSSVSKYVEGLLLIAVRRPYDLGDRIVITGPEVVDNPGSQASYFVEDINLFSTTLRFARTNEVSTINNSSISQSRITNCQRSPNAIIYFTTTLHISVLSDGKLDLFQARLERFVEDHPRVWDSLMFMRRELIDADMEQVVFNLAVRHRNSWQDAGRILINRGDLMQVVYEIAKDLKVSYDTPPNRRLLYYGGVLENGQVQDYKVNLLTPRNIRSHNKRFDEQRFETSYPDSVLPRGSFDGPLQDLSLREQNMSLLGLAIIGKKNEPLYLCDCAKILRLKGFQPHPHSPREGDDEDNNDDDAKASDKNGPSCPNDDPFGFLEQQKEQGSSLSPEHSLWMHSALDYVEEAIETTAAGLPVPKGRTGAWLGELVALPEASIYGHITATRVKFLVMVQRDEGTVKVQDVRGLLASIHEHYVDYMMNPFNDMRALHSKTFDTVIEREVRDYESGRKFEL